MEAKEYSKLVHLIANARETAEKLSEDMKVLNEHGGEGGGYASAYLVRKQANAIEKGLSSAIDALREIGADKVKKVAGQ